MPIYEYICRDCGHAFEHLLRTLSAPTPDCPKCGAASPAKQLSTFSASVANPATAACDACPTSGGCRSAGSGCGGACSPF